MRCRICGCFVEPKLDIRSLLAVVAFTALVSFVGGIFFSDWKLIPKFESKIEKDQAIKEELKNGYVPPRRK